MEVHEGNEKVRIQFSAREDVRKIAEHLSLSNSPVHASRVRCHICLGLGHTHPTCPLRFCRHCFEYGHSTKQCHFLHAKTKAKR